jgi:hypothetical protein
MQNYAKSVSFHSELKVVLLQLVEMFQDEEGPQLEKIEQLTRLVIRQKVDYLDAILDLFELSKDTEIIQMILISFVLKILRGNILKSCDLLIEYFDLIKNAKEKFLVILDKTIDIISSTYSEPYYSSKMLEVTYFCNENNHLVPMVLFESSRWIFPIHKT